MIKRYSNLPFRLLLSLLSIHYYIFSRVDILVLLLLLCHRRVSTPSSSGGQRGNDTTTITSSSKQYDRALGLPGNRFWKRTKQKILKLYPVRLHCRFLHPPPLGVGNPNLRILFSNKDKKYPYRQHNIIIILLGVTTLSFSCG